MEENRKKIQVFAHRGAPTEAPENTLAGFARAVAAGADGIEMDLRRTADGRVAIIHDRTVNRTTGGRGRVDSFTEDRLRELDAGSRFSPKFKGEKIPTLDEVLEWAAAATGLLLNLELKDLEIEEFAVRRVAASGMAGRVIFSSWNIRQLVRARELDAGVRVAPILFFSRQIKKEIIDLKPDYALLWSAPSLTRGAVAAARANNVPVIAWKVNSKPLLDRVVSRGAAAVMTDEVAMICSRVR